MILPQPSHLPTAANALLFYLSLRTLKCADAAYNAYSCKRIYPKVNKHFPHCNRDLRVLRQIVMCKYYYFGLKQHREKRYAFRSYFLYRSNPYKVNEAILVFGDVHGQVNALLFSAATMALFDRPSQPAGSKQGTVPSFVRAIFV